MLLAVLFASIIFVIIDLGFDEFWTRVKGVRVTFGLILLGIVSMYMISFHIYLIKEKVKLNDEKTEKDMDDNG